MKRLKVVRHYAVSLVVLSLVLMIGSPLIYQAHADEHDTEALLRGRELFEVSAGGVGCATCHGHFALGDLGVGPNIRGADAAKIQTALRSNPDMEFLSLSKAEIEDISSFLDWLADFKPAKVVVKDGQLDPAEITVTAADTVQLIIDNKDRQDYEIQSDLLGAHLVPARTASDITWQVSSEENFEVILLDDMGPSASLSIIIEQKE